MDPRWHRPNAPGDPSHDLLNGAQDGSGSHDGLGPLNMRGIPRGPLINGLASHRNNMNMNMNMNIPQMQVMANHPTHPSMLSPRLPLQNPPQMHQAKSLSNSRVTTPDDGRMQVQPPVHSSHNGNATLYGGYFDVPLRPAPNQLAPNHGPLMTNANNNQNQGNNSQTNSNSSNSQQLMGMQTKNGDTELSNGSTPLNALDHDPMVGVANHPVVSAQGNDFMTFREDEPVAFGHFAGPEPMDPVLQMEQELRLDRRLLDQIQPVTEEEDAVSRRRVRYKPRSSIPPDLPSSKYASQCLSAAVSSRLPPYRLHPGEYTQLRPHLSHQHITTYLNIRNGILRLWLANPTVNVTRVEAAGCVRNERFYSLAEFAFEWLVRNGYINHGCVEPSPADPMHRPLHPPTARRKPRQTIVVIGAGISGLACARQLHGLFQRYRYSFSAEYEDVPRVVLLEGRRRIGGRVCTGGLEHAKSKLNAHLSPANEEAAAASSGGGGNLAVDLGADTISGFGNGNPLATVLRRQLGLPVVPFDVSNELHDSKTGTAIDAERTFRAHELFGHMLTRLAEFESGMPEQVTAMGSKALMRSARDPPETDNAEEARTIAKVEELERPYKDPGNDSSLALDGRAEAAIESKLLKELGYTVLENAPSEIQVQALPLGGASSLGDSLAGFYNQLEALAKFDETDRQALAWYLAKFEGLTGSEAQKLGLNAFSHHRLNRFTGRHCWVRGGLHLLSKGLASTPMALDVRFKTLVTLVEYEHDRAMVTLNNGEQMAADRVVCTVPLGVLKRRSMQFIPDLPHWKLDSIERLEAGTLNKVVLLFDRVFWDDKAVWNIANDADAEKRGECFMLANHAPDSGHPLIVGLCSGAAAVSMTKDRDSAVVKAAVARLRALFPGKEGEPEPVLVESVVTHWQLDPLSQGSHSYVGVNGTVVDHDLLGRPVQQSLFFAGEATSRNFPGTVHGAYLSGLRAARDVMNSLLGAIEIPEPLIPPLSHDPQDMASANTPQQTPGQMMMGASSNNSSISHHSHSHQIPHQLPHQQQHQHQHQLAMGLGGQSSYSHPHANAQQPRMTASGRSQVMSYGNFYGNGDGSANDGLGGVGGSSGKDLGKGMNSGSKDLSDSGSKKSQGGTSGYHSRLLASLAHQRTPLDISELDTELANLRHDRLAEENALMEQDLVLELGERPERPERGANTNPFLLFQKDYWEICRRETEEIKSKDKRGGVKASRNEIRATLGKRWKTLPEDERAPYIQRTQRIKEENEQKTDEYIRRSRWYDAEADNFRQQWKLDHPSVPSKREQELMDMIEEFAPKKKRARVLND